MNDLGLLASNISTSGFSTTGFMTVGVDVLLALTTTLYLLKLLSVDVLGLRGRNFSVDLKGAGLVQGGLLPFETLSFSGMDEKRSLLHQNVRRRAR